MSQLTILRPAGSLGHKRKAKKRKATTLRFRVLRVRGAGTWPLATIAAGATGTPTDKDWDERLHRRGLRAPAGTAAARLRHKLCAVEDGSMTQPMGGGGAEHTGSPDVVVFSRAGCLFCSKAKALLGSHSVAFGIVDLSAEPQRRTEAAELSGSLTVPQVFVGGRCLGGYDDLKRLEEAGQLETALCWLESDGPCIAVTDRLAAAAAAASSAATGGGDSPELAARAEAMAAMHYSAGSRPSLRAFLRYAVTSTVAQDQTHNIPLNLAAAPSEPSPPPALPKAGAGELAQLLRQVMLQLLDDFVDPLSGDVDYLSMRSSKQWNFFRAIAAELGESRLSDELASLGQDERKAFFINLYNAMTFHGVVTYGRRPGWWYLYCFFITPAVSYRLAGVQVSLDDVEHGLLRARPNYFQAPGQERQRQWRLPRVDPRIHMALNCGAKGCPAVSVYSAGPELGAELDEAVAAFVADDRNVRVAGAIGERAPIRLVLSSLFKMYLEDFAPEAGSNPSRALARWLLPFARGEKRDLLSAALADEAAPAPKLEWLPYDWETNGPEVPLDSRIYTPTF
ncbi:unnamed protein product [Polarella glacialis]|uniref:Glutaredoxin domain-containing protein n=1 Tax=Polarella glacialis TaxID=89957 RepID=A0A813EUD2_POLGL|nr:unnamed protein product [Polarella glacialis]